MAKRVEPPQDSKAEAILRKLMRFANALTWTDYNGSTRCCICRATLIGINSGEHEPDCVIVEARKFLED